MRGNDRGSGGFRGGFRGGRGGRNREDDDVPARHNFDEDKAKRAAAEVYAAMNTGYDTY